MTELETRWPCPVCLGPKLEKIAIGSEPETILDHCPRCGGIWFARGEVRVLGTRRRDELWSLIRRREGPHRAPCHGCGALVRRDLDACPVCGESTLIACPRCDRTMKRARHAGLTLDVCERCEGVWFDHHELDAIWSLARDRVLAKRKEGRIARTADTGSDVLFETLFWAPDLVFYGAHAVGRAGAAVAEGIADAAPSALEAVGEAAGSVFEVIVEIVGSIFS